MLRSDSGDKFELLLGLGAEEVKVLQEEIRHLAALREAEDTGKAAAVDSALDGLCLGENA